MTGQQKAYLLMLLHSLPSNERQERLKVEIKHFGLTDEDLQSEILNVKNTFNNGIRSLNQNQLSNLLTQVQQNGVNDDNIRKRLAFYEINEDHHENIIQFFYDYMQSDEPIDVGELDTQFSGIQVASRDNFNTIINQGWTGDWDINPDNIEPRRVQVASMNDDGLYPRGYYLNADIKDIQPIQYTGKVRYRIFIENPMIVNTGNRNVKFTAMPVRHIRKFEPLSKDNPARVAELLGISIGEYRQLDHDGVQGEKTNGGLPYYIKFKDTSPKNILNKIKGLDADNIFFFKAGSFSD